MAKKETKLKLTFPPDTVFLVDGSSFLYRAFYSLPPMHTRTGQPVQVVYGFCRMIKKLINQFNPSYFLMIWDPKHSSETVRHQVYEQYKEQRQSSPAELNEQRDTVKEFASIIGLQQIEKPQIEADDILFSLAQDFENEGKNVILVTSDKDMRQCITDKVKIFDPFKDEVIDKEYVQLRYGIPVEKLVFYFALIGDAIDNIPGVRGIGPKTAKDLVLKFNSLEDLYQNLNLIEKPRTRELLEASRGDAFLSEKLFLLYHHDFNLTYESLKFNLDDWIKARDFFKNLDFSSLLKDLPNNSEIKDSQEEIEKKISNPIPAKFITITNLEDLKNLCTEIYKNKVCAIDTETDSLNPLMTNLVGISICTELGKAYYIPVIGKFSKKDSSQNQNKNLIEETKAKQCNGQLALLNFGNEINSDQEILSIEIIVENLKPIFENKEIKKYLHNAKFDKLVLSKVGLEISGLKFDTLIAANLVAKDWQKINLKSLSEYYLNQRMLTYAEVVTKQNLKNFTEVPIEKATEYAAADAHQTFALVKLLEQELEKNDQLNLFYNIEMPLLEILYKMEKEGVLIDFEILEKLDQQVIEEIKNVEQKIKILLPDDLGFEINLNSPRQLEELLFHRLKLPPIKKTTQKTGYSTDQEVLLQLAKLHPIPALIVKYRELFKIKSTYIDALKVVADPETKKIHTSFSQTNVSTGRLSSSEPNLQNIPVGNKLQIRSAFKAFPKNMFLSADYSQIELRVLAHLSKDDNLITAFKEKRDIHSQTAAGLFEVSIDKVTSEQRNVAKRINFSILYGLSPYGLSKDLEIPFKDAKKYIEKYFAQYPKVVSWMDSIINQATKDGYVQTVWGRRRYVPGIHERNRNLYEVAKRIAINTVVQGSAAELMKIGMINLDKILTEKNLQAKILLQIHDELILTSLESQIEETKSIVFNVLENVVSWDIPLLITLRTGKDWQEVTK